MSRASARGLGLRRTTPPDDIAARVIYRDALMLVIDKPAGIAVHKGRGDGPNLESQFHLLQFGLPRSPALAHRLDRETSGCLALGRHRKALARLNQLFRNSRVEKTYLAITTGAPPQAAGAITAPLGPASADPRNWRMKVSADGATAETRFRVLQQSHDHALCEWQPLTGRTHQIRVHAAHLGCPILGDTVYGNAMPSAFAHRAMLHALRLAVPLYPKRAAVVATAPLPADFIAALQHCGLAVPDVENLP